MKQDNAITNSSEEGKEEGTAEEKELTGTIDEIKDFMFVVTDENDTPYSFTFEEKPEGLENVSNGDTVTVKYTGTISEVIRLRERYYLLKRQNKIKTTMRLSAAMVFLSMLLCACTEASRNQELPAATYMGGKNTIAGICEELESAGASHVDTFREWTTDFADTAGKKCRTGG